MRYEIPESQLKRLKNVMKEDKFKDIYGFETIEKWVESFVEDGLESAEADLGINNQGGV